MDEVLGWIAFTKILATLLIVLTICITSCQMQKNYLAYTNGYVECPSVGSQGSWVTKPELCGQK